MQKLIRERIRWTSIDKIQLLKIAGANFFLYCANGVHRFVPRIYDRLPFPFVSIVEGKGYFTGAVNFQKDSKTSTPKAFAFYIEGYDQLTAMKLRLILFLGGHHISYRNLYRITTTGNNWKKLGELCEDHYFEREHHKISIDDDFQLRTAVDLYFPVLMSAIRKFNKIKRFLSINSFDPDASITELVRRATEQGLYKTKPGKSNST